MPLFFTTYETHPKSVLCKSLHTQQHCYVNVYETFVTFQSGRNFALRDDRRRLHHVRHVTQSSRSPPGTSIQILPELSHEEKHPARIKTII
jgi:hypothetical protein